MCEKKTYKSEKQARLILASLQGYYSDERIQREKIEQAYYVCDKCFMYHLTSMPPNGTSRFGLPIPECAT